MAHLYQEIAKRVNAWRAGDYAVDAYPAIAEILEWAVDPDSYSLGEQIQYTDIWTNDNYLQFMFERLLLLKELLAEDGFILIQCDHRKNHHLRCLLDEVFGPDNFRNEIASRRGTSSIQAQFETIDALIPGYPMSPVDLEELRRELDARPDEDRPVTLVCLGIELTAQAWIEEWNRLRKGKDAVNRIEVIELRTDPKYGKFIKHEPARAKVKIARRKDKILVEIEDFISPAIIERLQQQAGILSPKIDDWRAMVDVVMIDPAYDGQIFNVALSDVPERKSDLVVGRYELPAAEGETTVAVKIIDMLGEEVLVTAVV